MTIVNLKELLSEADKENYAVGCHNVINYESVRGILGAAEEVCSPIIIGIAQVQLKDVDFSSIMNIIVHEASRTVVPVTVHLDHGLDFETIKRAINLGCSSVMFDGSLLPLEENIEKTREIVAYAHRHDVSVEAEVGEMGVEESDVSFHKEIHMTDVSSAVKFQEETNVDALAVSFGTVHGITREHPDINLDLLERLNAGVNSKLVMHGGSGLSVQAYSNVIERGIRKINYFSYGYQAVASKVRAFLAENSDLLYDQISYYSIQAFKEVFADVMQTFGSAGKVR